MHPRVSNAIRKILRAALLLSAAFGTLVSLGLSATGYRQVEKNKLVFADFKDRVSAVRVFIRDVGRLPGESELAEITAALPVREFKYKYELADSPEKMVHINKLGNWPKGGWALYFWRGEWHEWYSSWNDHYYMEDQLSLWGFAGPFIIGAAVFSALCFFAARHKLLQGRTDALPLR